jgi:hypothetical protein
MLDEEPADYLPSKVQIKRKIYPVKWSTKEGHYDDHGHQYPYSFLEGYIKCPELGSLVPLHSLNKRIKIWAIEE